MSLVSEPTGSLDVALAHTARLLETDPALAGEQAAEIVRAVGRHPIALLLLAASHTARGQIAEALAILEPLSAEQPRAAAVFLELGLALGRAGRGDEAVLALRRAVALKPDLPQAWNARSATISPRSATVMPRRRPTPSTCATRAVIRNCVAAATALCENRIPQAEALLREHLKQSPDRRRRDPHAGRGRRAPRPPRRRRKPARALPGARAGLPRRAAELRAGAQSRQQAASRRWSKSKPCWPWTRAIPATATSRPWS